MMPTGSAASSPSTARGSGDGRPYRIAFLLPTFDIGGAERVVARTAAGLNRESFEPIVLAFQSGGGRLAEELRAAGVRAVTLRIPSRRSPLVFWRLWQWLRHERCDVLMSYMFHANLASRLVPLGTRVPCLVCSERVVEWETPTRNAINHATAGLADALTTNSAAGVTLWHSLLAYGRKHFGPAGACSVAAMTFGWRRSRGSRRRRYEAPDGRRSPSRRATAACAVRSDAR